MSSPDFSNLLTTLESSLEDVAESYVSDYTAIYRDAMAMVATVSSYTEYTDDLPEVDNDWTDVVADASEILNAAGQSPLLNEIYDQIEKEFGISMRTPLAMAQNIMQGSDSSLLKVVVAILSFELKMNTFAASVQVILDAMKDVNDYIANHTGITGYLVPETAIPGEIIQRLTTARNELQRSMGSPFDVSKYDLNTQEVRAVAAAMEEIEIFDRATDAMGNMALKMMLESTGSLVASTYRLLQRSAAECKKNLEIILTTDTTIKTVSTQRFVMAKKAVRRINGVLNEMTRSGIPQGLLIPKYIVALNVAYSILRTGRPQTNPAITLTPLDISGVTVTSAEIDAILASCRKLLRATQQPRKLVAIEGEITTLTTNLALFRAHVTSTQAFFEIIEQQVGYEDAFEIAETVLGLIQGLDMAQMFLENGKYSEFFNATESTATSEGSAVVAFSVLADLCDRVGMGMIGMKFREKSKEMQKQEREKRSKREARKERKKSQIATQIEEINKMIQTTQEMVATAVGTLQGITAVID